MITNCFSLQIRIIACKSRIRGYAIQYLVIMKKMAKYHYYKVSEIKKHSAYFYFHNYRPSLSLFAFRKRFPPNPEFKIAASYRFQELWFPPPTNADVWSFGIKGQSKGSLICAKAICFWNTPV